MRNKLFSLVLILLLFLGIGIFLLPQNEVSKAEKRSLITNKDINSFSDIETVLEEQIPFRENMISLYYKTKLSFNNLMYKVIPAYRNNDYHYLGENVIDIGDGYLSNDVLVYDKDKIEGAKSRGYNINQIDLKFPNIKTYVYFPTSIEEILYTYDDSDDGSNYRWALIDQLNPDITYSALELDSVDKYKELFYKSDFHWNAKGAYEGYKDIINMINKDFDIGEPKEIEKEIEYDYLWSGNVVSEIGSVGEKDKITDLILEDIGEYKYYVNNKECDYGGMKEEYSKNGNNTYLSDYEAYYESIEYERRFEFDNDKPNIIVFSDSFINVNLEWIASHFNTSIFIDLRCNDGSFNLDDYINKYDIDIVLVSQLYLNLYFNGYMFIPLD